MPGSLDKQPRDGHHGVDRNWSIKLFALPILFIVALIGFAVSHPDVSRWISEAAEAEFAGANVVPDVTPPATRLAKPAKEIKTVKVY